MLDPKSLDRIFHALGDPTRRVIVEMLSERPHSVSGLAEPLGITLTAVMQHLQVLEESCLVKTEKLGRVRTASLDTGGLDVVEDWIREHRTQWELRLDRLNELLNQLPDEKGE